MLAKRTQKLIQDIKPDTVMVMASPRWWETAKHIKGIDSQEEFNTYQNEFLSQADEFDVDTSYVRGAIFWARMLAVSYALRSTYKTGDHFRFYNPGLEIKYACEEAEKLGADLHFMGPALNNITWHRLYHETRLNIPELIYKRMFSGNRWKTEMMTNRHKLHLTTASQYVEVCLDQYLINWYIKSLELYMPNLKRTLIDKRDVALYKYITKQTQSKRIVAVVNQWHMEGIEHLWAHEFGQMPRSVAITDEIDPIGDMNLRKGLFDSLFNAFQRQYKSAMQNSVPSSYSSMMNTYHREQNWGYEHRNM